MHTAPETRVYCEGETPAVARSRATKMEAEVPGREPMRLDFTEGVRGARIYRYRWRDEEGRGRGKGGRTIGQGLYPRVGARDEPVGDFGDDVDEAEVLVVGVLLEALGFGVGGEVCGALGFFCTLLAFSLSALRARGKGRWARRERYRCWSQSLGWRRRRRPASRGRSRCRSAGLRRLAACARSIGGMWRF